LCSVPRLEVGGPVVTYAFLDQPGLVCSILAENHSHQGGRRGASDLRGQGRPTFLLEARDWARHTDGGDPLTKAQNQGYGYAGQGSKRFGQAVECHLPCFDKRARF
jgi:hypothetical protein